MPMRLTEPDTGHSQDGLSIVEVVVAVTILTFVSISVSQLFLSSSTAFSSLASRSYLTSRAQVVMDRLVDEFVAGRFITMQPPVPTGSPWIRFQKVSGFVAGVPTYADPTQIEVIAAADGGPGTLRIWRDTVPRGIAPGPEDAVEDLSGNIAPGGLTFTRIGGALQVRLTVIAITEPGLPPETYTLVSGVNMRNDE